MIGVGDEQGRFAVLCFAASGQNCELPAKVITQHTTQ